MWLYVRGVALVANRDFAGATAAASAIEKIERTADFKLLKDSGVPAQEVLRIARTVILARVAQARGDNRTAIVRFERAAALQDALAYTEPPYWYYPIRQSLAAALVAGRPLRRGGATIPARAQPGSGQWLVVLRTRGTA